MADERSPDSSNPDERLVHRKHLITTFWGTIGSFIAGILVILTASRWIRPPSSGGEPPKASRIDTQTTRPQGNAQPQHQQPATNADTASRTAGSAPPLPPPEAQVPASALPIVVGQRLLTTPEAEVVKATLSSRLSSGHSTFPESARVFVDGEIGDESPLLGGVAAAWATLHWRIATSHAILASGGMQSPAHGTGVDQPLARRAAAVAAADSIGKQIGLIQLPRK